MATMQLKQRLPLSAPPERVWDLLWDIETVARCIPGCEDVQTLEPKARYAARLVQRVGPFRVELPLELGISDIRPPSSFRAHATGRDARLGSNISTDIQLQVEPADGGANLLIDSHTRVMGKLATLGQSLIRRKAEDVLKEFAENIRPLVEDGQRELA